MNLDLLITHIEALVAAGNADRAQRVLRTTVRRFPHRPELWILLANVLSETNQKRDCLERALALDARNPRALEALAQLDRATIPSQATTAESSPPAGTYVVEHDRVEYTVTREHWVVKARLAADSAHTAGKGWLREIVVPFIFGGMLAAGAAAALLLGSGEVRRAYSPPAAIAAICESPCGVWPTRVEAGRLSAPDARSMPADLAAYLAQAEAWLTAPDALTPNAIPLAPPAGSPASATALPPQAVHSLIASDANWFDSYSPETAPWDAARAEPVMPSAQFTAALEAAVRRSPEFPEAYLTLARLRLARGETREALAAADAGLQLAPREVRLLTVRAEAYVALGAYRSALDDARLAVYLAPDSEAAYLTLAWAEAAQATATGQAPTEAIAALNDLVARLPTSVNGWMALGNAHRELGEDAEAIEAYTQVLALDPDHGPALIARGEVYLDRQNWSAARADFLDALRRGFGDRRRVTLNLARLAYAETRLADALDAHGVVSVATWLTPLPQHAIGNATFYGPSWGLLEDLAAFHNYDLTGFKGGVALPSPADLGKTVWLRPPGGEWEGPFLSVDSARRDDFYNVVYAKGEIVEVPYEVARRWGIEFILAGVEVYVGARPPQWSTPSPYRPELRWDAGDSPVLWPQPPQDSADR